MESSSANSIFTTRFLGGFDSIRGLPDGYLYGTKAIYTNLELRYLSHRWKYTWLQEVLFFDIGSADQNWEQLQKRSEATVGVGIRVAIPQVYRLMLRIDYGWSLTRPYSGFSIGLNHLFQPYRPL